eukprot:5722611-Ditylum_brightwellii.AAC.1
MTGFTSTKLVASSVIVTREFAMLVEYYHNTCLLLGQQGMYIQFSLLPLGRSVTQRVNKEFSKGLDFSKVELTVQKRVKFNNATPIGIEVISSNGIRDLKLSRIKVTTQSSFVMKAKQTASTLFNLKTPETQCITKKEKCTVKNKEVKVVQWFQAYMNATVNERAKIFKDQLFFSIIQYAKEYLL